ncbi:MAG: acyl-CoA dehydrogenase [Anaerolineae bacterium]|jgi:alkylation response protein AidB-like acyl-CoA dehydrogenase|nr:MAG: acyl-CoA dehydrogenase [Anaerolineae bacterium]
MDVDVLKSPTAFLQQLLGEIPLAAVLKAYEDWWVEEGMEISNQIDRAGTPWVRMFDMLGNRVDEILYPAAYWRALRQGYKAGLVWRAFEGGRLSDCYLLGYVTAFFDAGLYCPYTVSLSTAVPLEKYGAPQVKEQFLPPLLRKDDSVWQGATWMTEAGGGSDLGSYVHTIAQQSATGWRLNGEKYFASNAGAELAVVAARRSDAPQSVRGLSLFLLPRYRDDGSLNYKIRRLKDKIGTRSVPTGEVELQDSQAYLLGEAEQGIYLILETLNLSRVANSIGSVALMQRALTSAASFASRRIAFGKPIGEHPLLRKQFMEWIQLHRQAFCLAWEAVRLLEEVWREKPPYASRYHLFRIVAHLAKYLTAELAVQSAKWAMEVHGGMGILAEYGVERWLREAMILPIWEGTPHRQILDGLEAMERKRAHQLLFDYLAPFAEPQAYEEMVAQVEQWLGLPQDEKEAQSEAVFHRLARFTAESLCQRHPVIKEA